MRIAMLLATVIDLAACAPPAPAGGAPDESPFRVVGYLAGWGVQTKGTRIAALPADRLTHINYAFALIDSAGRIAWRDPCIEVGACAGDTSDRPVSTGGTLAELRELAARHPRLKILVAVGGWTGSARFSDVARTEDSRRAFARSAIEMMRRTPGLIDGFDIDWEFPVSGGLATNAARPEDRRNFTLLLRELRRQLDAEGARAGRRYLLTAATTAGRSGLANVELDSVAAVLDWFNVMTYDYHSGSSIAHFNAPLHPIPGDPTPDHNVDSTVALYLRGGVPASKIVLGIPFYGRGYAGVPDENRGLLRRATASGPPAGWTGLDWRTIAARRPETLGFRRYWSEEAQVPWLYNATTGAWITYDDPQSVRAKAAFARERRLGGVMIWEIGGDDGALMEAIRAGLGSR